MGQSQSSSRPPPHYDGAPSSSAYSQAATGAQQQGYTPGQDQQGRRPLPTNSNYARYPPQSQPAATQQPNQQRQPRPPRQSQQPQQSQPPAKSLTQTATIRNAVNLQKSSLRVVPSDGDPQFLQVAFEFDASEPCCAMTFVAVRERLDGSMKSALAHVASVYTTGTSPRPFQKSVKYDTGMKQAFPGTKEGASRHGIDLRLLREDAFLRLGSGAHESEFPLVVRLATVTEKGLREGHTLEDIKPGEPMPRWVQGQTTFASVSREGDGWRVKVLKQRLWDEGDSYMLQEIYGLEKTNSGRTDGGECVICFDRPKNTTVLPCRHFCLCSECADQLLRQQRQGRSCPICRNPVESLLRLKLNDDTRA